MKIQIRILFICLVIVSSSLLFSQDVEKKFQWTDDLDFQAPEGVEVIGFERTGVLTTNDKLLEINSPDTVKVIGNKIYAFDYSINKLLIFDNQGSYIGTPFTENIKLKSQIRSLDIDEKGRVLLVSYQGINIFDSGKVTTFKNYHSLAYVVWHNGGVLGFNRQMKERKNGLMLEVDLEGKAVNRWGEDYNPDLKGRVSSGSREMVRKNGKIYLVDNYINGFVIIDPVKKTVVRKTFNIPILEKRERKTIESNNYTEEHKLNRYRFFPTFNGIDILDEEIYLFLFDEKFLYVLVSDEDAKLKKVYKAHKIFDPYFINFSVTKVEGKPRFFITQTLPGGSETDIEIAMYSPSAEIPTLENKKDYLANADKSTLKRIELRKKQKQLGEDYEKAVADSRKVESNSEKQKIMLSLWEKYPDSLNPLFRLGDSFKKSSPREAAAGLKEMVRIRPEVTDEWASEYILFLMARLSIVSGDSKSLNDYLGEYCALPKFDLNNYKSLLTEIESGKNWKVLAVAAAAGLKNCNIQAVYNTHGIHTGENAEPKLKEYRSAYLIFQGKSLIKLEKPEEALKCLKKAESISTKNYLGVYDNEVDHYLSAVQHKLGRTDEAIQTILPGALFSGSKAKEAFLKKIYPDSGLKLLYKSFLWNQRKKLARKLEDATFFTYDGKPVKLSSKFGKATLITFWTPDT